jgi:hypothetical protein
MVKLYTLTFLVLFGSAAAADDRIQAAAEKHFRCTSETARWLAMMDGTAEALAERALSRCRAEERNLRRVLDANGVKALRVIAKAANTKLIEQERRYRGWASGPESTKIYCASCGMLPRWDQRLRVWRPHGR